MGNTKQTNIKNQTYYFFNHMINIKNSDPSLIKIDKKSYKSIDICHIGYITIKSISDCENINSVNPLYLMICEVDGYIKEELMLGEVDGYIKEEVMEINTELLLLLIKTKRC